MKLIKVFILGFFIYLNITFGSSVIKKLDRSIIKTNSLVCVGLDPDLSKMPQAYTKSSDYDAVVYFLWHIIDITAPHACCFKLQKAFYDKLLDGAVALKTIVHYIHKTYPDKPIIIDCKIGDIDNTMDAAISFLFEGLKADVVTINPYMGDEVFAPFQKDASKSAAVSIKTSNPGAATVQNLQLSDGMLLWQEVLNLAINRWNTNKNLMVVLPGNQDIDYPMVCQIPSEMPILVTGIGAQGGSPVTVKKLLNKDGRGVLVNSSRGILYSYKQDDPEWKDKVLQAVI